jgi:hypothetical protein
MAVPSKLGNTLNLAAWQKLKHKKDEKLGDNIRQLDLLLGQWKAGAGEATGNRLVLACENVAESASRVLNQPKIAEAVEQFCENIKYVTEGLRKEVIKEIAEIRVSSNKDNNVKMAQCLGMIEAHEKNVDAVLRKLLSFEKQMESSLKTMAEYLDGLKQQVGSVGPDGMLTDRPQQYYDLLIIKECLEPMVARAAEAGTVYNAIQPAQTAYRGNPQGVIGQVGLTDPGSVEKVKKIISTLWARVNKSAIAYETSYKKITTMLGEANACKTLAKKYLAGHAKQVTNAQASAAQAERETAKLGKFLDKLTATVQGLHDTIHEKCFSKTDFDNDYLDRAKKGIAAAKKMSGADAVYKSMNSTLTQTRNFQDILSTKLADARKLIAEAQKARKLATDNIKLDARSPRVITDKFKAFAEVCNKITVQEKGLVTKEKKAMPSLAAAMDLLKKELQKIK